MDVIDGINLLDNLNNESEVRCHDKPNLKYFKKREGFKGTVSCQVKCMNENKKTISIVQNFVNEDMKLRGGDGGLYASFNMTLDLWLEKICLKASLVECKTLDNIESAKIKTLVSGDWEYDKPAYCPTERQARKIDYKTDQIIKVLPNFKTQLHPFENKSGSDKTTAVGDFDSGNISVSRNGFNIYNENKKINFDALLDAYTMSEKFLTENEAFFSQDDVSLKKLTKYVLKQLNFKSKREFVNWRIKEDKISHRKCEFSMSIDACFGDCIITGKNKFI